MTTPTHMKALVYTAPKTLSWQDKPLDELAHACHPSESETILVKTHAVGICGSDMHAWMGHDDRRPAPLILGHEASGIPLNGPYEGQYVTVNPLVTCGQCQYCQQGRDNLCVHRQIISMPPLEGAFAEYFKIPQENLHLVPSDYDKNHSALVEPLACGWHAVKQGLHALKLDKTKQKALIIGAGAIGYGSALALALHGIEEVHISEINTLRRNYLQPISPFSFIDMQDSKNLDENAYAIVIDAHGGSQSRQFACRMACSGGVIVHIGLAEAIGGLDARKMTLSEIQFIGSYTYTKKDFFETAQALFKGKLGPIDWCGYRPVKHGGKAFHDISTQKTPEAKIILTFD